MDDVILDVESHYLAFQRFLSLCDVLADVDEVLFGIGGGLAYR